MSSPTIDTYIQMLDLCYFEVSEAFKDLADDNVWKRPAPGLLSIGEIAGHVAYWEAVRFAGNNSDGSSERDLSKCKIESPLLDPRFGYYTSNLEATPTEDQMRLTAREVYVELQRIHLEAMSHLRSLNPDLKSRAPEWSHNSNYGELLRYLVFHSAYHTGQIYSVRHLLGEQTPDN